MYVVGSIRITSFNFTNVHYTRFIPDGTYYRLNMLEICKTRATSVSKWHLTCLSTDITKLSNVDSLTCVACLATHDQLPLLQPTFFSFSNACKVCESKPPANWRFWWLVWQIWESSVNSLEHILPGVLDMQIELLEAWDSLRRSIHQTGVL